MSRPRQPLISRSRAVAAAIEVIDTEGLDALSLPRLARHLGVRAPSLYHHFADKSEILGAVVAAIVAETVVPRKPPPEHWANWFVQLSLNLRRAVLLLRYPPRELLIDLYEDAAKFLQASGVPAEVHVQILDSMDTLTLGAIISEAVRTPAARRAIFPNVDPDRQVTLATALATNRLSATRLFEEMIRAFRYGVVERAAAQGTVPTSRPRPVCLRLAHVGDPGHRPARLPAGRFGPAPARTPMRHRPRRPKRVTPRCPAISDTARPGNGRGQDRDPCLDGGVHGRPGERWVASRPWR